MTEADWLDSQSPGQMLGHLLSGTHRPSERKLRLLAVACCRRIWGLLTDERSRAAVEVAERYADGLASEEERRAAYAVASTVPVWVDGRFTNRAVVVRTALKTCGDDVRHDVTRIREDAIEAAGKEERVGQWRLLRCMFGNPFRRVQVGPAWLAWEGGTVCQFAEAIYEERAFERMPYLADALEEAGCTSSPILAHCRGTGEHVRGCHVVDAILGRE
jgi:hypothetical protein